MTNFYVISDLCQGARIKYISYNAICEDLNSSRPCSQNVELPVTQKQWQHDQLYDRLSKATIILNYRRRNYKYVFYDVYCKHADTNIFIINITENKGKKPKITINNSNSSPGYYLFCLIF